MARLLVPERSNDNRPVVVLLLGLLAVDLIFLVIHASHVRFDVPGSGLWLISRDRGYPELYQYVKEAAIIALTIGLLRRKGSPVYPAWALTFLYLLLDDSLKIHETLGEWLAGELGLGTIAGVEGRDLGQVMVSAAAGLVLLGAVVVTTARDRTEAGALSVRLGLVIVALAFFGVVTDVIDAIDLFGLVEDGGEMITMSVAVAVTVDHWRQVIGWTPSPDTI